MAAKKKPTKKKAAKKQVKKPAKKAANKKAHWLPKGHQAVVPYLLVEDGDKMLAFLQNAFGAKIDHVTRDRGEFRHGSLDVFGCKLMMGQAFGAWKAMPCALYVYVKDCDAAHRAAIAGGAVEIMPPMDMFYGDRHGGVTDPCGNQWWLATHIEDVSNAELERRAEIEMKRRAQQQQQS